MQQCTSIVEFQHLSMLPVLLLVKGQGRDGKEEGKGEREGGREGREGGRGDIQDMQIDMQREICNYHNTQFYLPHDKN